VAGEITIRQPQAHDIQGRVRNDPHTLLEELRPPVVFNEIQNAPELLSYVRTLVDAAPRRMGQWLFTGSQEAPLMQGITESMAGRAAILQLLPFSVAETPKANLLHGGFPEVLARNKTDLAAPLGASVPTVTEWLHILELAGQIIVVPPYFENLGKRLIKSPKVYWSDSGLACYLLGITTEAELQRSPFSGQLFEGFVAAEILKGQANQGARKELYYFRDQQGLEVDFLLPRPNAGLWLIECKAGKTVRPAMAAPLLSLRRSLGKRSERLILVHQKSRSTPATAAVASEWKRLIWSDSLQSSLTATNWQR
jgi:predicted AAA+ superfamily ATPase